MKSTEGVQWYGVPWWLELFVDSPTDLGPHQPHQPMETIRVQVTTFNYEKLSIPRAYTKPQPPSKCSLWFSQVSPRNKSIQGLPLKHRHGISTGRWRESQLGSCSSWFLPVSSSSLSPNAPLYSPVPSFSLHDHKWLEERSGTCTAFPFLALAFPGLCSYKAIRLKRHGFHLYAKKMDMHTHDYHLK